MSLKIVTVPCLSDNYAYILHNTLLNKTTLVDAPDFAAIKEVLDKENWSLDNILLTHHHNDHIAAVPELVKVYNPLIYGSESDTKRLPRLNVTLSDRDKFSVGGLIFKCFEVPGHTLGHIAFYCSSENIVFTGDSLMTLGCGRIFEGSPEQMFESLNQIKNLPNNTVMYSGHEYAKQNVKFALSVDPGNQSLAEKMSQIIRNEDSQVPNVPSTIENEKDTNPFLRVADHDIRKKLNLEKNSDLEVFKVLREMKDNF